MRQWKPVDLAEQAKQQGREVTPRYIRRLCKEGRIKATKPGRDWFIDDEEAQRWLTIWLQKTT